MRTCSGCGEMLPATSEFFHKNSASPDGRVSRCKLCAKKRHADNPGRARERAHKRYWDNPERAREDSRKWREANPEQAKETNRKWCAANPERKKELRRNWYESDPEWAKELSRKWNAANPERKKENDRKWAEANPERAKENSRKWREKNPERSRELNRKWEAANSEYVRANSAIQSHRRRTAEGSFTREEVETLLESQWYECAYCGADLLETSYHLDHVVPVSKGGTSYISNIAAACPSCNRSKGAKDLDEWLSERKVPMCLT